MKHTCISVFLKPRAWGSLFAVCASGIATLLGGDGPLNSLVQRSEETFVQPDQRLVKLFFDRVDGQDEDAVRSRYWRFYLSRPQASVATMKRYFSEAANEFGVPVDLLEAIAQVENNWTQIGPSIDYGWGVMHLVENGYAHTLSEAAELLEIDPQSLKDDPKENIRAAAALLAKYSTASSSPLRRLEDWFPILERFSGLRTPETRRMAATRYYQVLQQGVTASTIWGEKVVIQSHPEVDVQLIELMNPGRTADIPTGPESTDYGPAISHIAPSCNWGNGCDGCTGRNHAIDTWVNHWIGTGTYAGAISWFDTCPGPNGRGYDQNGNLIGASSAHFVIRASDGQITQCVRVANTAYHAGASGYPYNNTRSIGVEHEATAANPDLWNSTPMLQASTTMARYFCDLYSIPKIRALPGIRGHNEMPGTSTTCPGPLPWTTWMNLLNGGGSPDLTIQEPVTFGSTSAARGGTVRVDWTEKNKGTSASSPQHKTKIFLSSSAYGTTYRIGYWGLMRALQPDEIYNYSENHTIPTDVPPGSYYVTAFVDADQDVTESNENNNIGSSSPNKITITGSTTPTPTATATATATPKSTATATATATATPKSTATATPTATATATTTPVTRVISLSGDLAFGDIAVGSSPQRNLRISNTGNSSLNVTSINYPAGFSGSFSGTIPAGGAYDIAVTFSPGSPGNFGGTITVASNKTSGTNTIATSGKGIAPPPSIPVGNGAVVALVANANSSYVTAESAGNSALIANRPSVGAWERFQIVDLGDGTIALRSLINGRFVCAENGGTSPLIANRDGVGAWEKFQAVDAGGGNFALIARANGKYVCAENGGGSPLIANRAVISDWEKFRIEFSASVNPVNVTIGLQAANSGKYVTAENAGGSALVANRDQEGSWEQFQLVDAGNGYVGIRSLINGMFVAAENAGGGPLIANRPTIGEWEQFRLFDVGNENIALRSKINGRYVSTAGGTLIASQQFLSPSEQFVLNISLRSQANGLFVVAENAGQQALIANRPGIGVWEQFKLVNAGGGYFAMKAKANGRYVCADNAGQAPLIANRDVIGGWELFQWVVGGNGNVTLKALVNGMFVCAENGGSGSLIANRSAASVWEQFR